MNKILSRTPFIFLSLAFIVGIVLQYCFGIQILAFILFVIGLAGIVTSFFFNKANHYGYRWMFGLGTFVFVLSLGALLTLSSQNTVLLSCGNQQTWYKANVESIVKHQKTRDVYEFNLDHSGQHIYAYIRHGAIPDHKNLISGQVIYVYGSVNDFSDKYSSSKFDYSRYMAIRGISGYIRVNDSSAIRLTLECKHNLKTFALQKRDCLLHFVYSSGLRGLDYSIISALIFGYRGDLPYWLTQGFVNTGTIHVLSVSGLHVGVIFLIIGFTFGFISRKSKYYWLKTLLTLALLWFYVLLTGMSVSVVRAAIMLSIYCLSLLFRRRNFSINTLFVAVFFILVFNPLSLFDVSFQLSFVSVFFILAFYPLLSALLQFKNPLVRKVWHLTVLSFCAQIGVLPLCLYYFGNFPVYFFLANLTIVPLTTCIMYAFVFGLLISLLRFVYSPFVFLNRVFIASIHFLVHWLLLFVRFFEYLPFALIKNCKVSLIHVFFLYMIILLLAFFL